MSHNLKVANLLLVEHDENEILLMQRAVRAAKIANPLLVARSAEEALRSVRGESGATPCPRPFMMFVDSRLAEKSGLKLIETLGHDPDHKGAAVILLVWSEEEKELVQKENLDVRACLWQPKDPSAFTEACDALKAFWKVISEQ